MNNYENRIRQCCFTGHRPDKLSVPESEIKAKLKTEILLAIADGFDVFITGMAPGVDIWAAEVILELKKEFPLKLVAAIPHPGFEKRWSDEQVKRYIAITEKADHIEYICPYYCRGCCQIRNAWIVDRCARVIAVWNESPAEPKTPLSMQGERVWL